MREAFRFGSVFGLAGLGFNLANNLGDLDATANNVLSGCALALLVACSASAGRRSTRTTGSISTGALVGLGAGVVGAVLSTATLFAITFLCLDVVRGNALMQQDFARSGMADMDVFIVADAIGGSLALLAAAAAIGAAMGAIGARLGHWRRP